MRKFLIGERGPDLQVPPAKSTNRVLHPAEDDPFPLTTMECSEALGIPRQTLKVWIDEGVFKQGECWIQRTPTRTAQRWWNVNACRVALQIWNQQNAVETYEEVVD